MTGVPKEESIKNIFLKKRNYWKFSKFDENYKSTDLRYLMNSKHSKHKETTSSSLLLLVCGQLHLLVQCQPCPWDAMVRFRVNGFGHIRCLATFNSSKMDIVAISDHFVDLNYMVYMFSMIQPMENSMAQSRLRTGSLSSIESPCRSSRSEILLTSIEWWCKCRICCGFHYLEEGWCSPEE